VSDIFDEKYNQSAKILSCLTQQVYHGAYTMTSCAKKSKMYGDYPHQQCIGRIGHRRLCCASERGVRVHSVKQKGHLQGCPFCFAMGRKCNK